MPQYVEFNGETIEFPDGMSNDQIAAVLRKQAPAKKAEPAKASPTLGSIASNFLKGAVGDTIEGIGEMVTSPFETIKGIGARHGELLGNAYESVKKGDVTSAIGYGLYGAVPVLGPAMEAANARIMAGGDADEQARGLGNLASLVAAPRVMRATGRVAANVAGKAVGGAEKGLKASAVESYKKALNPTKEGNKLRTDRVVPKLIEEGLTGNLEKIRDVSLARVKDLGQKIGDAWDAIPDDQAVPVQNLLQEMRDARNQYLSRRADGTMGPRSKAAAAEIQKINQLGKVLKESSEIITQTTANGTQAGIPVVTQTSMPVIRAKVLRELRQDWDKAADKAGAFEKTNKAKSSAAQYYEGANRIRAVLDDNYPDISKLNEEFSTWKDVNKVAWDTMRRKTGQSGILQNAVATATGGAAGLVSGSVPAGIGTAMAFNMIQKAVTSPKWRTVSAVTKDRLANAIAKRNAPEIQAILAPIVGVTGKIADKATPFTSRVPAVAESNRERRTLADLVR